MNWPTYALWDDCYQHFCTLKLVLDRSQSVSLYMGCAAFYANSQEAEDFFKSLECGEKVDRIPGKWLGITDDFTEIDYQVPEGFKVLVESVGPNEVELGVFLL